MLGVGALIDIGGYFTPAVKYLNRVIAPLDFGEFDERTALVVDRHPGLTIDDVEIWVGPGDATRLSVDDLVPVKSFLEVEVFLPQDQPTTEHVFVRLDDIPVGEAPR